MSEIEKGDRQAKYILAPYLQELVSFLSQTFYLSQLFRLILKDDEIPRIIYVRSHWNLYVIDLRGARVIVFDSLKRAPSRGRLSSVLKT